MLYASLRPELATQLHDQGYAWGKRRFRLLTFSRLVGAFQRRGDELHYQDSVVLHIASPINELTTSLANRWLQQGTIALQRTTMALEELKVEALPTLPDTIQVRALSPIVVYSTFVTPNGKKTYYYAPFETDFLRLCLENLRRKYALVRGHEAPPEWGLRIKPLGVRMGNQVIVMYKGTVIKGWTGHYQLEGPPPLLSLALEAGLGAKNSQGFGMVELLEGGNA